MNDIFNLLNSKVLYVTLFMGAGDEPAAAVEVVPRVMLEYFELGMSDCTVDIIARDTVLFGRMIIAALITGDVLEFSNDEFIEAAIKFTVEDWLYTQDEPSALPPHQNPLGGLGQWVDVNE